jgi:hypothetical protein
LAAPRIGHRDVPRPRLRVRADPVATFVVVAVVQPLPGSTFGPNLDLGGDTATRSSPSIT